MAKKKGKFNINDYDTHYFADMETRGEENYLVDGEVSVFQWQIRDIDNNKWNGTDIQSFIRQAMSLSRNRRITMWFHNLKFDFSYIESELLRSKRAMYKHNLPEKFIKNSFGRQFTCTRDDTNNLYAALWNTYEDSAITFYDSYKIFPVGLADLGDMLGKKKLAELFDYTKYRPANYVPTKSEWDYLDRDTEILRDSIVSVFEQYGTVRMTRSSYAFSGLVKSFTEHHTPNDWKDQKEQLGLKPHTPYFDYCFPSTDAETYRKMQDAYVGGFVYVDPARRNKIIENVLVYDVNSEYPAAMLDNDYPIFDGIDFKGNYYSLSEEQRAIYPLYVQKFKCEFKLKDGGFPMLPKKLRNGKRTVYNSSQLKGLGIITLTNVDMVHFLRNYDVDMSTFHFMGGIMWQSVHAPFKEFIQECGDKKIAAEEAGNEIMRFMSKLDMNGCYGKFAQRPDRNSKFPQIKENGVVEYIEMDEDEEGKNYFPMAIFITAYARDILLTGIYAVGVERVIYVDTDSIHLEGWDVPQNLKIHKSKLGYWSPDDGEVIVDPVTGDKEKTGRYTRAKFLRDKMYIEEYVGKDGQLHMKKKGAGLTKKAKEGIKSIEEFKLGTYHDNNLQQKVVKGGIVLLGVTKFLAPEFDTTDVEELEAIEEYQSSKAERAWKREIAQDIVRHEIESHLYYMEAIK